MDQVKWCRIFKGQESQDGATTSMLTSEYTVLWYIYIYILSSFHINSDPYTIYLNNKKKTSHRQGHQSQTHLGLLFASKWHNGFIATVGAPGGLPEVFFGNKEVLRNPERFVIPCVWLNQNISPGKSWENLEFRPFGRGLPKSKPYHLEFYVTLIRQKTYFSQAKHWALEAVTARILPSWVKSGNIEPLSPQCSQDTFAMALIVMCQR